MENARVRAMITIDDNTKIKKIHFKFPKMFKEDAESQIIALYNNILDKKNTLANHRMEAMRLEQELKKDEEDFKGLQSMFDIEFEKRSFEEIHGEHNFLVINPTDYRNK